MNISLKKQSFIFVILLVCILYKITVSIFTLYQKNGFDYGLLIAVAVLILIGFQVFKIAKNSYHSKDK